VGLETDPSSPGTSFSLAWCDEVKYNEMPRLLGRIVVVLAVSHLTHEKLSSQQLAFPGAEGGGRLAVGGRGGKVIEVTNLNDSGPGSFRAAVAASGARTVVFCTSGTITLNSDLRITNDSLTIAGQTAPGDGICLRKYALSVEANHVVNRYLRFRLGNEVAGGESDVIGGIKGKRNIIIDHCSASWSTDETLSFYNNDSLTVQWCIISESLYNSTHPKGAHGYGGIWGGKSRSSFHHNLLAHHSSRNPRITSGGPPPVPSQEVDIRNNVIYNWGFNSAYGGELSTVNIVANYYKPGPATLSGVRSRIVETYDSTGRWYVADNYIVGNLTVTNDNWSGGVQAKYPSYPSVRAVTPFPFAPVVTQTAQEAYGLVLSDAGATFPKRDSVDLRIIRETRTGAVTYSGKTYPREKFGDSTRICGIIDSQTDVGGWPVLNAAAAPPDGDHDGMPDDWESARGLNPSNPDDRNVLASDGYTMLEVYLNSLVSTPTKVVAAPPVPREEFTLLPNYPNPFNPLTNIIYEVPANGNVSIRIYDSYGRLVKELLNRYHAPGRYRIPWDGSDAQSVKSASGVYFAVVRYQTKSMILKLLLLK
jgi:pectate lyase